MDPEVLRQNHHGPCPTQCLLSAAFSPNTSYHLGQLVFHGTYFRKSRFKVFSYFLRINYLWRVMGQAYLVFTALCFIAFFYQLKVCDNPASSKSIGIIFPIAFAYFMSLCHVLAIFAIFQTFRLLLYGLWWSVLSVIFDVTIVKILRLPEGWDDG